MTALADQSFSLTDFYAKRIRRILPALVVVIVVCLIFSWFFLFPTDFVSLGKHSAGGILNISNLVLWSESGYFDTASHHKPLLHLWSLGIEEQFYLIWPLLLILFFKFKRYLLGCLIGLTALSFVLNVIATHTDRTLAFYMPMTRFWELSAGGLLAYCVVQRIHFQRPCFAYAPIIGFVLIALATALLNQQSAFPGYWALLPVLGTCLMIAPTQSKVKALAFLQSAPMLFIGRISFSLYLWHWPMLLVSQSADLKSRSAKIIALVISFVLAWLTYRLIEQPFRSIKVTQQNAKKFIWIAVIVTIAIATAGALIATRTVKRSWDETLISKSYDQSSIIGCGAFADLGREFNPQIFDRCDKIQFPANATVLLLGDSHSQALYQGLKPFLDSKHINLVAYPILECTPLSLNDKRPRCVDYNKWIREKIQSIKPDLIIMFAHHLYRARDPYYGESISYQDYLWQEAGALKAQGIKNVWIIGDIPNWQVSLPHAMNFNFLRHDKPVPERTYVYVVKDSLTSDTLLAKQANQHHQGVEYISLKDALCTEQGCMTSVGQRRDFPDDLIVMDYGHLTNNGAAYLSEHVIGEKIIRQLK